jgi:hypothetical protein
LREVLFDDSKASTPTKHLLERFLSVPWFDPAARADLRSKRG